MTVLLNWLRRWGLWVLFGLAGTIWLITKLLPDKPKSKILRSALSKAAEIKNNRKAALENENKISNLERKKLDEIRAIADKKKRLRRLAEYANRKRDSP